MPTVYVSKQVKKDLIKLINRSRISPEFGSPKKLKNPNEAMAFLLKIGLRYHFKDLENLAKIPIVQGEMSVEDFDNPEVRDKKILEEFENV